MYDDGQEQALEEGRYWFCLTDVVDYMELLGEEKVFQDLSDLFAQRNKFVAANKDKPDFEDLPF